MEELAKKVQQRYVDDITARYPLHRFICLYLYLLAFYIYYIKKDARLISSIREIKVDFLFDFDKGLIAQTTLFQLLVGIIMTFITAAISSRVKRKSFEVLSSLKDFDGYVVKLKRNINNASQSSVAAFTMTTDISRQLDLKRVTMRAKQAVSEIVIALMICMLIGIAKMNPVDWLLVLGGASIVVVAQWESFKVYISEFLPYFVAEQSLLGKDVTFSKGDGDPHV